MVGIDEEHYHEADNQLEQIEINHSLKRHRRPEHHRTQGEQFHVLLLYLLHDPRNKFLLYCVLLRGLLLRCHHLVDEQYLLQDDVQVPRLRLLLLLLHHLVDEPLPPLLLLRLLLLLQLLLLLLLVLLLRIQQLHDIMKMSVALIFIKDF